MVRAVGQDTFQPKIGFKTRYGMVANPFAEGLTQGQGALTSNANRYYRRVKVTNLNVSEMLISFYQDTFRGVFFLCYNIVYGFLSEDTLVLHRSNRLKC